MEGAVELVAEDVVVEVVDVVVEDDADVVDEVIDGDDVEVEVVVTSS